MAVQWRCHDAMLGGLATCPNIVTCGPGSAEARRPPAVRVRSLRPKDLRCAAARMWSSNSGLHTSFVSAGAVARRNHSLDKSVSRDAPARSRTARLRPSVGTGVLHPVGSNRRPAVAPDPAPRTKLWEPGRGVCPARMPDAWVVVWSPPHPPVWTMILGPSFLRKSALFGAEFLRIFGACGATSRGGWGGSAHYPDPTAQSAPGSARRTTPRLTDVRGRPGGSGAGPRPACLPKSAKKFVFFGSC